MTQTSTMPSPQPHKIQVLFGSDTIEAYEDGEDRLPVLRLLGEVKEMAFTSIMETNAFLRGLELSQGSRHVLAVDDLQVA